MQTTSDILYRIHRDRAQDLEREARRRHLIREAIRTPAQRPSPRPGGTARRRPNAVAGT